MANYRQLARQKAKQYGLDPNIFERQIQAESGFNPNAVSPAGARGIAQIMPATAKGWGVNPSDPAASLDAAARNMAQYVKKYGSYKNALVAYNAGPGRVGGSLPVETQNYIKKILGGSNPPAPRSSSSSYKAPSSSAPTGGIDKKALALSMLLGGNSSDPLASLLGGVSSSYGVDPLQLAITAALQKGPTSRVSGGKTPSAPSTQPQGHTALGSPIAGEKAHPATHETAGLPGYPAYDYMAKPGTQVVAPISGRVVKLSGHDPRLGAVQGPGGPLGWSVYIKGDDGKTYFLTHMGSRTVRVGQRVKAGMGIGTVANYDKYGRPSHIHEGVHG